MRASSFVQEDPMNKVTPGASSRAVPSAAQLDVTGKARREAAHVQQTFWYGPTKATIDHSHPPVLLGADPKQLLDERGVAALLGLSPATMRNWRVKGLGPNFQRLSARAIRYRLSDVEAWLSTCARRSTSHTSQAEGGDDQ
jgi:predicted DNA-binding transcriptional regulator AlpA